MFGYRAVAYSSVSLALVSFIVWGHHMFVAGQSQLATVVFSALTFLVAIPSGVKMFNWLSTMYKGNISLETPHVLRDLVPDSCLRIGGLTGIFLGTLSTDVHLTDTYFVVAHFHYVMMGGPVIAFVGGLHYLVASKITGRMYNETLGPDRLLPGILGLQPDVLYPVPAGQPRNAAPLLQLPAAVSGLARYFNGRLLDHRQRLLPDRRLSPGVAAKGAADAPDNPWGGTTLEWQTSSPPITHNFQEQPVLQRAPYDYRPEPVTHA